MAMRSGSAQPLSRNASPQAMKSSKVFRLLRNLPSSYQRLPISLPPRMWPTAKITPRSSSEIRVDENLGSIDEPYEPYP